MSTPYQAPLPHPSGHAPSELSETEYDVIVVGAGAVGENVADYASRGGLRILMVEDELVGGECSYWACMPSKALLRSGQALAAARAVDGARQAVTGELDTAAVLERRTTFTHGLDDASQLTWLDAAGLDLVRGRARLVGERALEVTGHDGSTARLTARHAIVLCTGSAAALPPVDGLEDVRPWTSREATSAPAVPDSLLVLGGGVVGVEMASAWHSLGSAPVTILQRGERLVPGVEPEAGRRLAEHLRGRGIEVRLSTEVTAARREDDGSVVVTTSGGELRGAELLVATGRRPRTDDLGLDVVGLSPGKPIPVEDTMQVPGVPWLYACGDCTGRVLLTHQGKYEARAAGMLIAAKAAGGDVATPAWSRFTATADHDAVPQVIFTDPEIAAVGLTEQQARDKGLSVVTAEYELGQVAGASVRADDYSGWAKLVVDADRRVVVGATFLGPDTAELLHAATIALVGEVPLERLWHAVPSYPTVSEVWLRLLDSLMGELGWQ